MTTGREIGRRGALARLACRLGAAGLALPLMGFGTIERLFAPSKSLWARWTAQDPRSTRTVDHAPWTRFIGRYRSVDAAGVARLAYGQVTADDRAELQRYLDALARIDVDGLARPEQMAFWINLYNARTVALMVERYPVKSIRDVKLTSGLFATGPWDAKLMEVRGEALSLNDVEHRILRPIWNDARIHYAVNCASVGCPNLQPLAYAGATVEAMLEQGARGYVNDPRGVTIVAGGLVVSSIYSWFAPDFGGTEAGVVAHLRRHAEPALKERLYGAAIIEDRYDWSLNDVRPA